MRFIPLLCSLVFLALSSGASSANLAMFRSNPEHTGVYATRGLPQFHRIRWTFHTGGYVVSSPAVVNGTVYVGSVDGSLYALDRASGALKWKFPTGSRIVSSPAVENGVVYFGSYDGNFYAVDAARGVLKWKFKTAGERRFAGKHLHGSQPVAEMMPDPFDVYLSSPVVWHGAVFFGSGDGNIYSLDVRSGALNWRFTTGDVVHASPAIAGGMLYVGSWDSFFYALDAATGQQKWRFKTGEDHAIYNQVGIQSSAAVANGLVFFGCRDSHLYALDAATGQQRWSVPTHGSWVVGSPAVSAGRVYFATSDSGLLSGVNAQSGKMLFTLQFHGWPMFSSPALAGGLLYIGSHSGKLIAIDPRAAKIEWTFVTDAAKRNGPRYTKPDGTPNYEPAFASDFYDDLIVGYAKMMTVGAILSSPVIDDGMLFVGSTDGNVYALM